MGPLSQVNYGAAMGPFPPDGIDGLPTLGLARKASQSS